ncbi:hypothetical protein ACE38W_04090 [Chitinophaga sp. Hz27]|uniref:hypothetical protein n=1 Tax=Chitinophaga sp. Hz27 TaxID=3347169 RepID=UPI0035E00F8B
MNKILLLILCLFTQQLWAQSNISANRIVIKDSLSLDGKWIRRINNDSTLKTVGDHSISTDAAMKKYIDKVAGGNASYEEQAKALLNPNYLEVWFRYASSPVNDSSVKFTLNIESSDGVKTSYGITGVSPFEIFYAYGKPPFSLSTEIRNNTTDTLLSLTLDGTNKFLKYYYHESNSIPGEKMQILSTGLKGIVTLILNATKITSGETYLKLKETVKNYSAHHVLKYINYQNGTVLAMPGTVEKRDCFWKMGGTAGGYAEVTHLFISSMGDYVIGPSTSSPLRLRFYKNGALFKEEMLSANSSLQKGILIDDSWTDCEIVLEDI